MTEQLSNLDGKFHFILYEACGSRMLKNVLTDFHRYVQMARRMSVKVGKQGGKINSGALADLGGNSGSG